MRRVLSTFAIVLCFLTLPAMAAGECETPIRSISAPDGQTGGLMRIQWSLGGVIPLSQTLSGSDFEEAVSVPPGQLSHFYVPDQPGEKHATLTVVTDCGTFSREVKYHVQQCNVVQLPIEVDKTSLVPGEVVTASVDLPPGHRARWTVIGGTPSATSGASIQITAGNPGTLRISVFIGRGDENSNSCEVRSNRFITISQPCAINTPQFNPTSDPPIPNSPYRLYIGALGAGETVSFNVQGATMTGTGADGGVPYVELITPAGGTFTIDVIVTKAGCSRTFVRTYEVTPCEPTATVTAAPSTSCDTGTVHVEFTGTAPFQGYWNDGYYFFTYSTSLDRTVTTAGTYTIANFIDARCNGTVSGEAVVGAGLPAPSLIIDDIANGGYYGNYTCPGLVRTAYLTTPIPAGAQVVWGIENGTIVSGQGTSTIQWSGTSPGTTTLTAAFRDANGCTGPSYVYPYVVTQGIPEVSITVEPSTIDAGQTAVVKVTRLNNFVVGTGLSSSLGDNIVPIGPVDEFTYQYEYRSTSGAGQATITAYVTNACGDSNTATASLTINQGAPVVATATIRQYGTDCTNWGAYAEMTGVAPFSGTWSNGTTFTSDYPYVYLYPIAPGTFTITDFRDANGPGVVNGSATFDYVDLPEPVIAFDTATACPNTTATATITSPVPEGATVRWDVYGATILSGQGTASVQLQLGEFGGASVNAKITAPGACSPYGYNFLPVAGSYVQQPYFDLYGLESGATFEFTVWADPNTATLGFENSLGDPMELVSNPSPGYYILRYTSTHGPGTSNVRVYGTTHCGLTFERTATLIVLAPAPTATLTTATTTCGATITVTFTGTAPFTATWWETGETFTTNDYTYTKQVSSSGYWTLYNVTDATGRVGNSASIYAEAGSLPYPYVGVSPNMCPGGTVTTTIDNVQPGYEIVWSIEGTAGRIVSGQSTPTIVVEGVEVGQFILAVRYVSPEGCEGPQVRFNMTVEGPVAPPVITLPATTLAPGQSMEFEIHYPESGLYNSIWWYATAGNTEFVSYNHDTRSYTVRYTAPSEPGTYDIHALSGTTCGTSHDTVAQVTVAAP